MKQIYSTETEDLMRLHYSRLSEKDRRLYAAIEAKKLGFGGKLYIVRVLSLSSRTLYKGLAELDNEEKYNEIPVDKQRRSGGGRKKNMPKISD